MFIKSKFVEYPKQITLDLTQVEAYMPVDAVDPKNLVAARYNIVFWLKSKAQIGWEFMSREERDFVYNMISERLQLERLTHFSPAITGKPFQPGLV